MSMAPLGSTAAPAQIENCTPGSTVELTGEDFYVPTRAIVVQMMPEYGPNSIPHLLVKLDGSDEEKLVSSSGRVKVTILQSTKDLTNMVAPSAVKARLRPQDVRAIQFVGGVGRATEIIQFGAGKASLSFDRGNPDAATPETMSLNTLSGATQINIGDWVVQDKLGEFTIHTESEFAARYETAAPGLRDAKA